MQTIEKPEWLLLPLNGVLCPGQWEEQSIDPYIRANVLHYWKNSLSTERQQEIVMEMRTVASQDRFGLGMSNIPLINYLPPSPSKAQIDKSLESLYHAAMFCLDNNIISSKLLEILKPCWMEGLKEKRITVPVCPDIRNNLERFKKDHIKIGVCCLMPEDLCKLILAATKIGDLNPLIDDVFNQEFFGPRNTPMFYEKILKKLSIGKDNHSVCMLSNNGQDVRAAKENGCAGVIIQRPDHPIREYYQLRFSVIHSLDDLQFLGLPVQNAREVKSP